MCPVIGGDEAPPEAIVVGGGTGSVVDGLMLLTSFWGKRVKHASRRSSGVD